MSNINAASYTKTKKISSSSVGGASATIETYATYSTTGDERWTSYGTKNYKPVFSSDTGITMTKNSWSTSGSDTARYHQKNILGVINFIVEVMQACQQ